MNLSIRQHRGFTLIELVMVIVVLGIVAAIAIPKMSGLSEGSRINATKSELLLLKRAIVGNPSVSAGGRYIDVGFEGDIGHPPLSLSELGVKSDSLAVYDKFIRIGWNGPYVDTAEGDYLTDAWGINYVYNSASRTIISVGGPDTIAISF
jgi:prepilin-type N-terminal cleavage/methylation domain-containing protein